MSQRVVLAGAFGFVGSAFRRALERDGIRFTILTRDNRDAVAAAGPVELFVDAAGNSRKYLAERDPAFDRRENVDAVRDHLADFRPERYVLLSSSAVYADVSSPATTAEADTPGGEVSTYGRHKREAERLVRADGAHALVLRPAGFVGPGLAKGPVHDLLEGDPPRVDSRSRMQLLDVDDFAQAVLALASAGVGGTFNAVPAESVVLADAWPEAAAAQRGQYGPSETADLPRLAFGLAADRFAAAIGRVPAGGREILGRFAADYLANESRASVPVLILAGGRGTRLPGDTPKPVRPLAGAPLAHHVAAPFHAAGYARFRLLLGHASGRVASALSPDAILGEAEPVVEEAALGTGGAVRAALAAGSEATALVVNGDTILRGVDLVALVKRHRRTGAVATLLAASVPDTAAFGRLETDDHARLVAFREKAAGGPGLVHTGAWAVDRARFLAATEAGPASLERDHLPRLAAADAVHVMTQPNASFIDAGTPAGFARAEQALEDGLQ